MSIKILLVEDQPEWRRAIRALVESEEEFCLCGEAADYDGALEAFELDPPDVALLDWQILGEKDGLAVGHALVARGLAPDRIWIVSGAPAHEIPAHPFQSLPKPRVAQELMARIKCATTS